MHPQAGVPRVTEEPPGLGCSVLITGLALPQGPTEVGLFPPFLGGRLLLVEFIADRREKHPVGTAPELLWDNRGGNTAEAGTGIGSAV